MSLKSMFRQLARTLVIGASMPWFSPAALAESDWSIKGEPIPSPDRAFNAVILSTDGGGGISPYCFTRVAVVPTNASPNDIRAETAKVFASACDSFGIDSKCSCVPPSPRVEWVAPNALKITFSIRRTTLRAREVLLRRVDATGAVRITFAVAE